MYTRLLLFLILTTLISCKSSPENQAAKQVANQATDQAANEAANQTDYLDSTVFQAKDKEILQEIFEIHKGDSDEAVSTLMVRVGRFFLGTPYVAHTLEAEAEEQIIINLRELDCTTFAENCLALSRTIKSENLLFDQFAAELLDIRYRDGKLDGYPSRLHYFCDWIHNNQQKMLISNLPENLPQSSFIKEINFMSTHPASYRQLKEDSTLIGSIAAQEKLISSREMFFIPETGVAEVEDQLKDGDIVGITTNIEGIAIQHVGILVRVEGRFHLLHASSKAEKVVLSEITLEEYLLNSKSAIGIMLARPL